ncbi:MAG: FecR domain-containing protein, partial [Sphingomonas sp.]|nr:FecR domain-containing protein [Sphingomonas sp.]
EADRIGSLGAPYQPASRRFALSSWQPAALAASVLIAFAAFLVIWQGLPGARSPDAPASRYETPVGGHQLVALADGSRVELNTATVIRAAVTDKTRAVWLERGEAFFSVAKRDGQKFVIYAGPRTITVLGTKFSVRRAGDETVVAVLEGRVRLQTASLGTQREALVTGGEIAVARDQGTLIANSPAAVQHQLAWRAGMIDLDGLSLAAAAEQFNRYNSKQLVIGDAQAGQTPLAGSFVARNVDSFARLLQDAYGLQAVDSAGRILVSSRRIADRGPVKPLSVAPVQSHPATSLQSALGQMPLPAPVTQLAMLPDKQAVRDANNWDVIHKLYPPRALAAGEEGIVGFIVEMDATGSPTKCKITHTSGHPLLDLETCQLIMEHAIFSRPTGISPSQKRSYEGVVNWRLPTTPAAAVPVQPKAIAQSTPTDPLICKRQQKTGSLASFDRKCLPKSEWERATNESRDVWTQIPGRSTDICEGPQCK